MTWSVALGLPAEQMPDLGYGVCEEDGTLTVTECIPAGTVSGILKRSPNGCKTQVPGSTRGLTLPTRWRERAVARGVLFICEGMSDTAAAWCCGLAAVGRPSAGAGDELVAALVALLPATVIVIVVGDDDAPNRNGGSPGRDGACKVAERVAERVGRPLGWAVASGGKDIRHIVTSAVAASEAPIAIGVRLERSLLDGQTVINPPNDRSEATSSSCPTSAAPAWTGPPLPLPNLPPVPPFPLHVLPKAVGVYIAAAAASIGVPPDYVAAFALPLLGAAVGRSRAAVVKRTFRKPPLLWTALVAPPSAGKSPALALAAAPVWKAEGEWRAEYEVKLAEYERALAESKAAEKVWRDGGCEGDPPAKPVRPTLRQVVLDDTTAEAAARVLRDNPRGCVLAKDELSGFVLALNQYKGGKGADRQFFLSAWALAPTKVNRAGDKDAPPLLVPAPFLAVAGALCPDLLPVLRGDTRAGDAPADGFIDRFLTVYPDPLPATGETWAEVPEPVERAYRELVARLLQVDLIVDADAPGGRRPFWVDFDAGGKEEWERFTTALAGRMNALDADDPFRATLGKLREYGLRLAALLWCLRHAAGEFDRDAPIDADTMGRAAELVGYFEAHARRCHGRGVTDKAGRVARRLVRWLADGPGLRSFTRSQAYQQLKDKRDVRNGDALNAPLALLVDHGFVRSVPDAGGGRPGPAPQTFAVNPLWRRSDQPASIYGDSRDVDQGDSTPTDGELSL